MTSTSAALEKRIYDWWKTALESAYLTARGTRRNELQGQRVSRFDTRGLHQFSELWGQVLVCQGLLPELRFADADPILMRKAASKDAEAEFREELLKQASEEKA